MRIISGKARGTKLYTLEGENTRPTLDRVKESIFNIIQSEIEGSKVLDLFAGSGNLGIEALSEGAKYAYLVDKNIKCIKTIKKNVNNIGIENVKIIHNDYRKVLKDINKKFDLIFLDMRRRQDKGFHLLCAILVRKRQIALLFLSLLFCFVYKIPLLCHKLFGRSYLRLLQYLAICVCRQFIHRLMWSPHQRITS